MDKKPRTLLAVLLVIPLLSATGGNCADEDDGWQRAVRAMTPFDQLTPTEIAFREEGRIEGTEEACLNDVLLRLRCLTDDGTPIWDSVATTGSASANPDLDVDCVSKLARVRREGNFTFPVSGATLLSPGEQKRVRSKPTETTRTIEGRTCRVHDFEWRRASPDREKISGWACLDVESGLPLSVESTLRRPPKGLRRLSYTAYYGPVLENAWAVRRMEIDFFLEDDEGEKPSARMTGEFSGHARSADLAGPGACEK